MILFFVFLVASAVANAAPITVTDGNSTVVIDPTSSSGMFTWSVDGVDQMFQQWFWYRIGNTGPEQAINTLSAPVVGVLGTTVQITYTSNDLEIRTTYNLTGAPVGSGTSDVAETIRITNLSGDTLDLHFFQYSDFDLDGTSGNDIGQLVNANTVRQWDATNTQILLTETVVTPAANHYEIDTFANTLNSLTDGLPTTLSDSSPYVGPGDVTWAFEWDRTLAGSGAGSSFIISKDKNIATSPVPEPASLVLMGMGLLGVGLLAKKRS